MRPVRKIDFKVQDYMIRPELNTLTEYISKPLNKVSDHIDKNAFVQGEKKVYDIYQINNPFRNPKIQYFAVDEKELLDNVLAIGRAVLDTKERKAEERGFNQGKLEGYKQGINEAVDAIRKLPWYKRLFNYF